MQFCNQNYIESRFSSKQTHQRLSDRLPLLAQASEQRYNNSHTDGEFICLSSDSRAVDPSYSTDHKVIEDCKDSNDISDYEDGENDDSGGNTDYFDETEESEATSDRLTVRNSVFFDDTQHSDTFSEYVVNERYNFSQNSPDNESTLPTVPESSACFGGPNFTENCSLERACEQTKALTGCVSVQNCLSELHCYNPLVNYDNLNNFADYSVVDLTHCPPKPKAHFEVPLGCDVSTQDISQPVADIVSHESTQIQLLENSASTTLKSFEQLAPGEVTYQQLSNGGTCQQPANGDKNVCFEAQQSSFCQTSVTNPNIDQIIGCQDYTCHSHLNHISVNSNQTPHSANVEQSQNSLSTWDYTLEQAQTGVWAPTCNLGIDNCNSAVNSNNGYCYPSCPVGYTEPNHGINGYRESFPPDSIDSGVRPYSNSATIGSYCFGNAWNNNNEQSSHTNSYSNGMQHSTNIYTYPYNDQSQYSQNLQHENLQPFMPQDIQLPYQNSHISSHNYNEPSVYHFDANYIGSSSTSFPCESVVPYDSTQQYNCPQSNSWSSLNFGTSYPAQPDYMPVMDDTNVTRCGAPLFTRDPSIPVHVVPIDSLDTSLPSLVPIFTPSAVNLETAPPANSIDASISMTPSEKPDGNSKSLTSLTKSKPSELFACPCCARSFTKQVRLDVHMRVHTGEKPYVCGICSRGFSHSSNLKRHLSTHKAWLFPDLLTNSFADVSELSQCQDNPLKNLELSCPSSSRLQKRGNTVFLNQKNGDLGQQVVLRPSKSIMPVVRFRNNSDLHKKTSDDPSVSKIYECSFCTERFKNFFQLRTHMLKHKDRQVYICVVSTCGSVFTDAEDLIAHLADHKELLGQKKFVCSTCGLEFAGLHPLSIHRATAHPTPLYGVSPLPSQPTNCTLTTYGRRLLRLLRSILPRLSNSQYRPGFERGRGLSSDNQRLRNVGSLSSLPQDSLTVDSDINTIHPTSTLCSGDIELIELVMLLEASNKRSRFSKVRSSGVSAALCRPSNDNAEPGSNVVFSMPHSLTSNMSLTPSERTDASSVAVSKCPLSKTKFSPSHRRFHSHRFTAFLLASLLLRVLPLYRHVQFTAGRNAFIKTGRQHHRASARCRLFTCPLCPRNFPLASRLRDHLATDHASGLTSAVLTALKHLHGVNQQRSSRFRAETPRNQVSMRTLSAHNPMPSLPHAQYITSTSDAGSVIQTNSSLACSDTITEGVNSSISHAKDGSVTLLSTSDLSSIQQFTTPFCSGKLTQAPNCTLEEFPFRLDCPPSAMERQSLVRPSELDVQAEKSGRDEDTTSIGPESTCDADLEYPLALEGLLVASAADIACTPGIRNRVRRTASATGSSLALWRGCFSCSICSRVFQRVKCFQDHEQLCKETQLERVRRQRLREFRRTEKQQAKQRRRRADQSHTDATISSQLDDLIPQLDSDYLLTSETYHSESSVPDPPTNSSRVSDPLLSNPSSSTSSIPMRPSYSSVGSPQSRPNPQHLSSSSILRDDPVFDLSTSTCISLAYSNVQLSSDHLAHPHPPSDILTSSSGYPSLSSQTFVSNLDSSTQDSAKTAGTLELRCPVLAAVVPTPPPTPIWPVSMEEEGQEHEGLHDTHVETNRIEHLQIDRSQNEQQQPSCSLSCSPFKVCQSLCLIGTPSTGLSGHNLLQSQQPVPPSLCNLDERTSRTEEMAPIGLSSNCLQFPEFTRLESASALTDLDGKIASRQTASSQLPAHSTHSAHPALDCLQTTAVTNSLTNMRRSRRNVTFQQFWTPKPSRRKRKGEQTILQTVGTGRQTEPAACFPSPQLHNIGLA